MHCLRWHRLRTRRLAPVLALERVVWAPASEPVSAARVPAQEPEPESVARVPARAQVLAVQVLAVELPAQEPVLASAAWAALQV